jgi:poly(A) polymerase
MGGEGVSVPLQASPQYQAALDIARRLVASGHQAFFAGGCVRDLLLGVDPKDYDVATSATPDQIVALFPKTFAVGAHFGVILVCTPAARRQ